ncbi:hypothetical protein T484DRAFT_3276797 [Baffinella frigidus]|nr:hypothetical protein T484DRAFT_3276797 [Cryptophyta sp. CCMP2293]
MASRRVMLSFSISWSLSIRSWIATSSATFSLKPENPRQNCNSENWRLQRHVQARIRIMGSACGPKTRVSTVIRVSSATFSLQREKDRERERERERARARARERARERECVCERERDRQTERERSPNPRQRHAWRRGDAAFLDARGCLGLP